jgi:hypothetical protein
MPINHLKFIKKMIDKYTLEYPQLENDLVADIIDTVLMRAPENYFTFEMVQEHPEMCKQCGECCKHISCKYFNGKTCDEYATRYDACLEWPFYEIDFDSGLSMDPGCQFAVKLAEMVLDAEFQHNIDLLEIDEDVS